MPIDVLEETSAIDLHAHQPTSEFLHDAGGEYMQDAADRFGTTLDTHSYEEMIEPGEWLEQFAALDFPEDVQRGILRDTARKFLGL